MTLVSENYLVLNLRHYQEALSLTDWDIVIIDEPPDEGYDAQVWRKEEEKYAEIRVNKKLRPAQALRAMVHELIHLLMLPVDRCVTFPTFHDADRYGYEQERFINTISTAVTGVVYQPPDRNDGD